MGKKVLLCDDDIHILRSAEIKVSRSGYEVRIAHDGQEAWELILQERPDILVTDVQMPRLDGIELSRRIRENPETRDLPVLMLTAKGFELPHEEMLDKLGVVEILSKPFSPRELVKIIERTLNATPAATR